MTKKTGKIKSNLVVLAIVETLAAAAITVAVVGVLAYAALFSTLTPIILAATLAAMRVKSILN